MLFTKEHLYLYVDFFFLILLWTTSHTVPQLNRGNKKSTQVPRLYISGNTNVKVKFLGLKICTTVWILRFKMKHLLNQNT